jgi:SAM-dependent methyltransferase
MIRYIKKSCLFCGAKERLTTLYPKNFDERDLNAAVFSARRTSDHFHYQIVRCQECGLVFSNETLPDEALLKLYGDSHVTFGNYIPTIRKDYWRHLQPFVKGRELKSALEIGCSSGFFLEELKSQGFHKVYGCEPSLEAKNKAVAEIRDSIHLGFFQKNIYPSQSFDLVCSFQTLDHLPDPLETLRNCREILKPGGLAYFICHNVEALQAKILKEKSPIIDIEHIYLFSKKTLRRIFEKTGFKVVDVGSVKNSYPLNYWLEMAPLPAAPKRMLKWIFKVPRLGQCQLPLTAGNIYIIAEVEKRS